MIISLIFVIISLSTIGADRYHPSFNTKQLNSLDTRTNVKPHQTALQFCNKLWASVKVLPPYAQSVFLELMFEVVKGEEIYQNILERSLVHQIKLGERLLIQRFDTKISKQRFSELCKSTWDEVVELSPPSQARIRTKIVGLLEGATRKLENNQTTISEKITPSADKDSESEYVESEDVETTTEEPQNNNNDGDLEQEDLPSLENVLSTDDGGDDNDEKGGVDDDDELSKTPTKNLGPKIYIIEAGNIGSKNFERRLKKVLKKAYS